MIPVTPCPKPAAAGCSLQKSTGLFALPLATPSRGWHVTYITTPVLYLLCKAGSYETADYLSSKGTVARMSADELPIRAWNSPGSAFQPPFATS